MLLLISIGLGLLTIGAVVVTICALLRAPRAYEDGSGFHVADKQPPVIGSVLARHLLARRRRRAILSAFSATHLPSPRRISHEVKPARYDPGFLTALRHFDYPSGGHAGQFKRTFDGPSSRLGW